MPRQKRNLPVWMSPLGCVLWVASHTVRPVTCHCPGPKGGQHNVNGRLTDGRLIRVSALYPIDCYPIRSFQWYNDTAFIAFLQCLFERCMCSLRRLIAIDILFECLCEAVCMWKTECEKRAEHNVQLYFFFFLFFPKGSICICTPFFRPAQMDSAGHLFQKYRRRNVSLFGVMSLWMLDYFDIQVTLNYAILLLKFG